MTRLSKVLSARVGGVARSYAGGCYDGTTPLAGDVRIGSCLASSSCPVPCMGGRAFSSVAVRRPTLPLTRFTYYEAALSDPIHLYQLQLGMPCEGSGGGFCVPRLLRKGGSRGSQTASSSSSSTLESSASCASRKSGAGVSKYGDGVQPASSEAGLEGQSFSSSFLLRCRKSFGLETVVQQGFEGRRGSSGSASRSLSAGSALLQLLWRRIVTPHAFRVASRPSAPLAKTAAAAASTASMRTGKGSAAESGSLSLPGRNDLLVVATGAGDVANGVSGVGAGTCHRRSVTAGKGAVPPLDSSSSASLLRLPDSLIRAKSRLTLSSRAASQPARSLGTSSRTSFDQIAIDGRDASIRKEREQGEDVTGVGTEGCI